MKKCSFCGHENHDDANFCAKCGRTFVVKEIRKYLGKTFEILGYVAIGLAVFAFIFELVDNIIWGAGFFAYPLWLVKYVFLAGLGFIYLYAQKVKSETLSLLMSTSLIVHILIFFIGMNFSAVFSDFANTFFILLLGLLAYLFATLILLYLNNDWGKKLVRFYPIVTVGVVGVYAFIVFLYMAIFGFRGTYFRTIAFETMSLFFYFASLTVLFALPIVDKEIDTVDAQGTVKKEKTASFKKSDVNHQTHHKDVKTNEQDKEKVQVASDSEDSAPQVVH